MAALMEAQQRVAFAWADGQIGKELVAMVDGPDPEFANHVRGRTTAEQDALGHFQTWDYDAANNITAYTDANGNTTHYVY